MQYLLFYILLSTGCSSIKKNRIEKSLDKGKPEKALRIARKARGKYSDNPKKMSSFEDLYTRSLYASILTNPTIPRVQYFINKHPHASQKTAAERLLFDLSLIDAKESGLESQLIGLANERHIKNPTIDVISEAEKITFENLEQTSSDIQSFLLRFPNGNYYNQAQTLLADLAYLEAQQANTVSDWSNFLRRFPNHKLKGEAEKQLRITSWNHMNLDAISVKDLWDYTHKFPNTTEGWNSAVQALSEKTEMSASSFSSTFQLSEDVTIQQSIFKIQYDIGASLPTGYTLESHVDVKINDVWTDWNIGAIAIGKEIDTVLEQSSNTMQELHKNMGTWNSKYPLCKSSDAPLETRFCLNMKQNENQLQHCTNFFIDAYCKGPEDLLFLTLEDDIFGPVAHKRYDTATHAYQWRATTAVVNADWHCSHIHHVTEEGVEAICGKAILRIGWDGGVWLKNMPSAVKKVERIAGTPWHDELSPWTLQKGKLYSKSKTVPTIDLNDREAVWFKTPSSYSFDSIKHYVDQVKPVPISLERPQNMRIFPIGGTVYEPSITTTIPNEDKTLINIFDELYKTKTEHIKSFTLPQTSDSSNVFYLTQTQNGVFAIIKHENHQSEWAQILNLPEIPLANWFIFHWEDNYYIRGITSITGNKSTIYTIRWNGDTYTLDNEVITY